MGDRSAKIGICLVCWIGCVIAPAQGQETFTLENPRLGLSFDRSTGTLAAIQNKLSGETYHVGDDLFEIEGVALRIGTADTWLKSLELQPGELQARYEAEGLTIDVSYTLRGDSHFAQKHLTLTATRDFGLKNVVVSRPTFSADDLTVVEYRYPKFGRPPGTEPTATFFGRTPKGGFFTGVRVPFDASFTDGRRVVLQYAPSLKVAAGEPLACEPVYFGVYRRTAEEQADQALPLRSESDAMVAMTSAILGPPRFGLVPMACGWHSEMETGTYTEQSVAGDMQSLEFLAACGIDWLSDSHPWGGETEKMNALGPDDRYEPGPLVQKFLEHARGLDIKVVMWSSMNNTHAWSDKGRPFRSDKPHWLLEPGPSVTRPGTPPWLQTAKGNCLPNRPFFDWLLRINLEGMAAGQYPAWAMDGDFFGGGGWYTSVIPVDCQSDQHDHLPGDSNYACQRALKQLTGAVREHFPDTYIFMCRPPMDLGVWALANVDVCFTILEEGTGGEHVKPLDGLSDQPLNVTAGDQIRTWSRVRVHHDFFPHYLDQPLLFPSRAGSTNRPANWPSGHLDYIMLSALASSPNQLYYMPTKNGIPERDQAEIRKWLDWGRENVTYLQVRKDLPQWPAAGIVDGSAHLRDDRGLIFLFNPGKELLQGEFALTDETVGIQRKGIFHLTQEYPESDQSAELRSGDLVRWPVPGETAVVLRLEPVD
jgi:hypothetical protein